MKKILLFFLLACFGIGVCVEANARPRKRVTYLDINTTREKRPTKGRSVSLPIMGIISPDGNSITLRSDLDMGVAYIVISGDNGIFYTDMIDFKAHLAILDTSELDAGSYTITIEFETGSKYAGAFQFIEN